MNRKLYGLNDKAHINSLDFAVGSCFSKIFCIKSRETITECICGYLIISLLRMLLTKECAVLNRNTLRLQTVFVSCLFKGLLVVFLYYNKFITSVLYDKV